MKNQIKTLLLLGVMTSLLVGAGALVGPGWAWGALALAVAINVGAYFFSDRIVLALHRARPLGPGEAPRLSAIVAELAGRAGIPAPRLMLVDDPGANAFATGRSPARGVVAVTSGLLAVLDEREVRGVLAHEIAHIKHRDVLVSTIASVLGAALTWIAHTAQLGVLFGHHRDRDDDSGAGALALALVAPFAAVLLQLGISRTREYLADAEGARLSGDPGALADALEKLEHAGQVVPVQSDPATANLFIVSPLAGAGGVLALLSTHPPMAERVRRLRAMSVLPSPAFSTRFAAGWR